MKRLSTQDVKPFDKGACPRSYGAGRGQPRKTIEDLAFELAQSLRYLPKGVESFDIQRLTLHGTKEKITRRARQRTMARLTRRQRVIIRALRGSNTAREVMATHMSTAHDAVFGRG